MNHLNMNSIIVKIKYWVLYTNSDTEILSCEVR